MSQSAVRLGTLLTLLLSLLALLARPGLAQVTLSSVTPNQTTTGLELTIQGTGFVKKPVLFLTQDGSTKKTPLKVLSFTETQAIAALNAAATAGTYTLNGKVQQSSAQLAGALAIVAPSIASLSTASAAAKAQLTLTGTFLGTKKGTVKFGTKASKVVSWSNISIVVEVPKAAAGSYEITVKNTIGSTSGGTFTILASGGSGSGQIHFTALLDGVNFAAEPGGATLQAGPNPPFVVQGQVSSPFKEINVRFTYDLVNGPFPANVEGTADALVELATLDGGNVNIWRASPGNGMFTITLTSASGGRLKGTCTATMPRVQGAGPDTIVLASGDFEVAIP
ncbi:MAG: IPT/TIG domain-containing protein [Planctomycetes bacterium]|nr:IPT/TIG domain-containing protein [Planctomycetota bacterium]